jgi:hypothetical protein
MVATNLEPGALTPPSPASGALSFQAELFQTREMGNIEGFL